MIARGWEIELIGLTDKDETGMIDDGILNNAIGDASAEIDAYLQRFYTLPLLSPPDIIVRYTCDIARYFLYETEATERVEKRYNAIIRYLEQVAKGVIVLAIPTIGTTTSASMMFESQPATDWSEF